MYTVYRLNANELTEQFFEALKTLFHDKEIEIVVTEVDETAYLLSSEANRQHLLQSIHNIEASQNLIEVSMETLQ